MIAAFCRLVVDDIKCRGSAQEAWFGHFSVSLIYSDNGNGQITLKIFHGSHPTIVGGNSDWQVLHNLFAFLSNRTPKLQGDIGREKEGDLSTNHCHSVMPLKERPFNQSGHSFTLSLSYTPLCLSLSSCKRSTIHDTRLLFDRNRANAGLVFLSAWSHNN